MSAAGSRSSQRSGPTPAEFDALTDRVARLYSGISRFAHGFVRGKLRTDPVTGAVLSLAANSPFGVVADLGCGRGQLGLALLVAGVAERVIGLDRDAAKIAEATRAAAGLGGDRAEFAVADLAAARVPSCDTALIVDILYQLPEPAQHALLVRVAAAARRRVLIRAFDPDRGWRARVGFAMEWLGRAIRRDGAQIAPLPLEALIAPLEAVGFSVAVTPCWGGTPLPNVLLMAERVMDGQGSRAGAPLRSGER